MVHVNTQKSESFAEVPQVHTVRFYRPEYKYFIKQWHLCTQVVQWLGNI